MRQFWERPPASLFEDRMTSDSGVNQTTSCTLIARAASGDLTTLDEAHATGNPNLYSNVLDALIDYASSCQEAFEAIVRHVLETDKLRTNVQLVFRMIRHYETAPDRRATAQLIHAAGLADDSVAFEKAVEAVLRSRDEGNLRDLSPKDLQELFDSEYWVLGSEVRRSGAGFSLRQRLTEIRCQLASANEAVIKPASESLPATTKEQSDE